MNTGHFVTEAAFYGANVGLVVVVEIDVAYFGHDLYDIGII